MKDKQEEMKPTYYYLNKYFYYPPYLLWVWLGKRLGFKGMTYLERYNHFNKLGEILNDSFTNSRN